MGSFIRRKTKCLLSYISESTAPYIVDLLYLNVVYTHTTIRKIGRFLFKYKNINQKRNDETLSKNLENVNSTEKYIMIYDYQRLFRLDHQAESFPP